MSESLTGWKKWVVGIGMILSAVAGWLVATFDGDDSTKADAAAAYAVAKDGINIINSTDSTASGEAGTTAE